MLFISLELPSVPGETGKHNSIQLVWVPGHMGIDGN